MLGEGVVHQPFTVMGDDLYLLATDGVHGKELWKSDGTTTGTVMVYQIFDVVQE